MSEPYRAYDRLVIGAGAFGLYAAHVYTARDLRVAVVDVDRGRLMRASLVNQARVHNGYHYPRSAFTALASSRYYERFCRDFPQAVNRHFTKIYAISSTGSWTDAEQFEKFCVNVGIRARRVDPRELFRPGTIEAAYETSELSFDAGALRGALLDRIRKGPGTCDWFLHRRVARAEPAAEGWSVELSGGERLQAAVAVNATYAGVNAIRTTFGFSPLPLKYELCEVALVASPQHRDVGVTVMDGPFFSLMPFGHTGLHSLTAVDYTPRRTSAATLPLFECQQRNPRCCPEALDNCAACAERPSTTFPLMQALARKYLRSGMDLAFVESLHSVKTVLQTSEVDDARPTLIRTDGSGAGLITVLSGKINTLYDLEEVL